MNIDRTLLGSVALALGIALKNRKLSWTNEPEEALHASWAAELSRRPHRVGGSRKRTTGNNFQRQRRAVDPTREVCRRRRGDVDRSDFDSIRAVRFEGAIRMDDRSGELAMTAAGGEVACLRRHRQAGPSTGPPADCQRRVVGLDGGPGAPKCQPAK